MPKTVAIICEYNPFHNGHLYQINKIREELGSDTAIIGIMSGNYTQRGESAIADKFVRAKCAVNAGVNLILELPFPFSSLSAELFARSAVHIANSINVVDYLSFGSESGNLDELLSVASAMATKEFEEQIAMISKNNKGMGYPEKMELALSKVIKQNDFTLTPNNILAIEYLKSLKSSKSSIKPHTVKRKGASFDEVNITSSELQSATAIRNYLSELDISALEYIPEYSKSLYLDELANGNFPCSLSRLSTAILSSLRLNLHPSPDLIPDTQGGLYNRLKSKALEATDLDTLLHLTETKVYTKARVRRAILYSFLGVTSSETKEVPLYTQVLAMDTVGKAILKKIGKDSEITILTKPSKVEALSQRAMAQWELNFRADSVFQITKPKSADGRLSLMTSPYVKK